MILPIYASLERIDLSLVEAAKDLYASARQAFLRVTLPLTMPGVVAGVLLTFIPAFGDYINAEFLGGANNTMIGNKIQSTYLEESNYPEAAALSFLMMAAVLIVVFIYIRLAGTEAFIGAGGGALTMESATATADPADPPPGIRGARPGVAARARAPHLRGVRGRLHADPDRGDRGVLVRRRLREQRPARVRDQRRVHARVLAERLLDHRS